jgi:toxin ParE1/3/4
VKVSYRQAAKDDVIRQFRYYLLELHLPEIAVRFRNAVMQTIRSLCQRPRVGALYTSNNPQRQGLRSWPVRGFEALRIYYLVDRGVIEIVRVLHGKRDVKGVLEDEPPG